MKKLENKSIGIIEKILNLENTENGKFLIEEMKRIGIEKLPYSYSSLKKFIDSKTMNIHYNKHYKGYVDKLNKLLSKKNYGDLELEVIVKSISKFNDEIKNNAGGAFNHALFWKMLSPKKQNISGAILDKIKKNFGSYNKFKTLFEEESKKRFGSGWVWLILTKNGKLKITSTPNQENPLMNTSKDKGYPLLGLDLWEHSYYLKYQNKREEYISNFWECVNWDFVNKLLEKKMKTKLNENVILENILNESISERCTPESVDGIRVTFNINPNVKKIYRQKIDSILKSVFPSHWKESNEYSYNSFAGIYDFEKPGRSVLNKLNTNYNVFCILLRDLNKVLRRETGETINIIGLNPKEQIENTIKFTEYLEKYKHRIFNESSSTFKGILKMVGITNAIGESSEEYVLTKLKEKFGEKNAKLESGLGVGDDMLKGIDCVVTINGVKMTGQIKPFETMIETDKNLKVVGGQSMIYKTNLMIFYKKNKSVLIFKNKDVKIDNDGDYLFPRENLIYVID